MQKRNAVTSLWLRGSPIHETQKTRLIIWIIIIVFLREIALFISFLFIIHKFTKNFINEFTKKLSNIQKYTV